MILEAAYVGAPIICSDIPQNRYGIVEHAMYFRCGDVADLSATLQRSLDAPERLAERAAAGSRHVADHFSWEKVVDAHIAIFTGHREPIHEHVSVPKKRVVLTSISSAGVRPPVDGERVVPPLSTR